MYAPKNESVDESRSRARFRTSREIRAYCTRSVSQNKQTKTNQHAVITTLRVPKLSHITSKYNLTYTHHKVQNLSHGLNTWHLIQSIFSKLLKPRHKMLEKRCGTSRTVNFRSDYANDNMFVRRHMPNHTLAVSLELVKLHFLHLSSWWARKGTGWTSLVRFARWRN